MTGVQTCALPIWSALSNVPRGAQAVVSGVKGHLVQLVGQSEQDAAQHAAAIGKADDPVLLVGADGVPAHHQSDRAILAKQLGISEHQLSYITHSNSGEGLLFYGDVTIPFVDRFPKGEIYNLLTTRPEDLKNEAKTE